MKKIIYTNVILAVSALALAGCSAGTNSNTIVNVNRTSNNSMMNNSMMNNSTTNMNKSADNINGNSMSNASGSVSNDDKEFMTEAAQGGMAEVKLGELASTKAGSAEVKSFGQKMVTDHGKANNDLKALAAKKNFTLPTDVNSEQKALYDKLSKLSGAEFDKEYVNAMVEDHENDLDSFKSAAGAASDSDLKAFAGKYAPVIESHYNMIKAIKDKMK